ncbi:MAG: ATP-binding cassette domain-containing protein [Anaerolineales bacterium]|nr:ATP-binding cassette domain-containing protein [Anaerolineales bacterium]
MALAKPAARQRQRPDFKNLTRAIRYLDHYRVVTLAAYAALFFSTFAQLLVPQMVQNILDAVTQGLAAQQISQLPVDKQVEAMAQYQVTPQQYQQLLQNPLTPVYWAIGFILVFAIARGLFSFAQSYMSEKAGQSVAFDFRNELFAKIQRLSFSYHDRNRTGQLMVRATDDVEKVRLFIGQGLLFAVQAIVLLTGALIMLLLTNWRLTLVIIPILPIAMGMFLVFGAISQPLFIKVQQKLSALNTILQENLAGIKVVKAFASEPREAKRFEASATDLMAQQISVMRIFSFLFPVIFLVANLGQAAVLYFGGREIINGALTVGEWQKFSLYLVFVFFPLGQLGFIISQMSQASASANRVFEIMDAQNDVVDKPGAVVLPPLKGEVTFENVLFRYFGSSETVLNGVSFAAQPGQTVAILGATGSGKSSVINLIPRFYDVTGGRILVDGRDIRDVTIESLRRQIGIVLQETNLFTGTIAENIAFGRPDAGQEEIEEAARAAAAHDFIASFPDGYTTPVGERGATLSGGQKQRIAIARALLMNPRILILDDSTSAVDVQTEVTIQSALDRLMKGRTSFVIAQRISTVLNADNILVLDKGRIAAQGKHEDLMETSELYAEIYQSQLVEDPIATAELAEAQLNQAG